jgi:ferredoxin
MSIVRAATIRVEPLGAALVLEDGETVMEAAHRQGYYWPTTCHGAVSCGQCWFTVESGAENLPPPGASEQLILRLIARAGAIQGPVRLGCCAMPTGDVVVTRLGVRAVGAPES